MRTKRPKKKKTKKTKGGKTILFVVRTGSRNKNKAGGKDTVPARPIKFNRTGFRNHTFCVHRNLADKTTWTVSEYATGLNVVKGAQASSPKQALAIAKITLSKIGYKRFKQQYDQQINTYGPVN